VDEDGGEQRPLDPVTRRLGRRVRIVACAANPDGRSETLVALPSMREANRILMNPVSGRAMSFAASIADLRDLVIPQRRHCSRLRGAEKIGMWSLLLGHAAQLHEMTLPVASLRWLRVCEDEVFLASWVPVPVPEVKPVKQ
jgi:hypothetical protein